MELLLSIITLSFQLGIPVAFLTWYLFSRLYDRGQLDNQEDPRQSFKALKARTKKEGLIDSNLVQQRWMKFGGGFYGLTALWTLVAIEFVDVSQFIMNFPGFSALFSEGIISFVIGVVVNQLLNLLAAFLWFGFWDNVLVSIAVSYIGYLVGMNAAQRGYRFNQETLRIDEPPEENAAEEPETSTPEQP